MLVLAIKTRRIDRVLVGVARIVVRAMSGELRRNKIRRLLLRLPTVLPIAVRRMSYRPGRDVGPGPRLTQCPCPLHESPMTITLAAETMACPPP
jgi:hypothetical protein